MNFNKIKITIVILMAGFFSFLAEPVTGQKASTNVSDQELNETDQEDYAILVRKIPHIQASIKTARQMKANDRHQVGKFEVIICGKVLKKLGDRPKINKIIDQGKNLGIRFSVCGMTMKKFGIEQSDLVARTQVVPNGLIRMFDLQKQGYHTVEL